jgi:hypothetical protein
MKYFILFLLFSTCLSVSFAQKIDNKKGVTYYGDKPLLKIKGGSLVGDNAPAQISSYGSDKLLFVLTKHYYRDKEYHNVFYNEIRFADFDLSFKSSYDYKPLIKSLLENKVIKEDGELGDRETIDKYIRLYGFDPPLSAY